MIKPNSFQYPSLQAFGEELVTVLDFLHVKYVIGFGDGAGANVLARFALENPTRLLGLILINCTGSAASVLDSFKNKYFSWSGKQQVGQSTEDFLIYHRYGHQLLADTSPDKENVIEEFREKLHGLLNPSNVKQYVSAFLSRKDLSLKHLKVDTLLLTGLLSPYANEVDKLFQEANKEKTTILKVERAGHVLNDTPAKIAQSLLLFCKGQGLLSSVAMPGIDRRMSRGMSMEEYDKPNIRRLSLTTSS
ncbi:uncharacterized protein ZK1073.1-like [Chrysoperla carnea]|uniref:uncharacterized protein ZK1073.1-like n=1 Tax=Chrysoperla carnea TaxID=189513 RepID=UPI001D08BCF5|nr:uncharacterized protein ZK1073.1-like [Chrysoperla carnea]